MKNFLNDHSRQYLILDYNHLFVSSSLREEIWLLRRNNDDTMLSQVLAAAQTFDIRKASADRALTSYSGGEQAVLACLLIMAFIQENQLSGLQLLLVNVLESLSSANRTKLLNILGTLGRSHGLRVYCAREQQVEALEFSHDS